MRLTGAPAALEVRIDRKAYSTSPRGELEVLQGINFAVVRGEVAVFVGPSGCGKTTMLRIIAGLDRSYMGTVLRPKNTRCAMVFQEPRLLPWRNVEENVRLVAPDVEEAVLTALLTLLELQEHRFHYPGELSLGLARRASLARAFAIHPDLLILDEPLVSLDQALAAHLRDEIAVLVDHHAVTTILVTHSLEDAVSLGDGVFVLSPRPGRVLAQMRIGTPRSARTSTDLAELKAELSRLAGSVSAGNG